MDVTLPLDETDDTNTDATYLPPIEASRLRTQLQTKKALESSMSLTEKYWRAWVDHYLTALRAQHRLHIDNKKGCTKPPREGDVVLVGDCLQKRNHWKLAKIVQLVTSQDGAVREVEILCNRRTLRRPVNQLFPLEIEGYHPEKKTNFISDMAKKNQIYQTNATICDQGAKLINQIPLQPCVRLT
ncbi:unnamed protein product [Nippostrongylus brasiliensis]|uniref:DUF5641 domain-containing protein n=1 Tax=Nippostrongylus brasiliensis TaxID=27835 RepID=A0A0N4Y8C6_NIPBR|nr:unnamed protein product [Nippostrongylus brasiliensis]